MPQVHLACRLMMVLFLVAFLPGLPAAGGQEKKAKRRTGSLAGMVLAKGNSKDGRNGWVEIKADGEERGRKYWPVAAPGGGGPDPKILAAMRQVRLGARVRIEWIDAGDGKDVTRFEVLGGGK